MIIISLYWIYDIILVSCSWSVKKTKLSILLVQITWIESSRIQVERKNNSLVAFYWFKTNLKIVKIFLKLLVGTYLGIIFVVHFLFLWLQVYNSTLVIMNKLSVIASILKH